MLAIVTVLNGRAAVPSLYTEALEVGRRRPVTVASTMECTATWIRDTGGNGVPATARGDVPLGPEGREVGSRDWVARQKEYLSPGRDQDAGGRDEVPAAGDPVPAAETMGRRQLIGVPVAETTGRRLVSTMPAAVTRSWLPVNKMLPDKTSGADIVVMAHRKLVSGAGTVITARRKQVMGGVIVVSGRGDLLTAAGNKSRAA